MRFCIARIASISVALGGAATASIAGDAPSSPASCKLPVAMTCKSTEENGKTYATCTADVMLVQQESNTHIYGCELRIRPRILDGLSVDVEILKGKSFRLRNVKFNSEVNSGESQVAITTQRSIKKTKPAKARARIEVSGVTPK